MRPAPMPTGRMRYVGTYPDRDTANAATVGNTPAVIDPAPGGGFVVHQLLAGRPEAAMAATRSSTRVVAIGAAGPGPCRLAAPPL